MMDLIDVVQVTVEIGEHSPFNSIDLTESDEENTEITLHIGTDNVKLLDNDDIMLRCTDCHTLFVHAVPFIEHVIEHQVTIIRNSKEPFSCICDHCGILFQDYYTFQSHYASHAKAYCEKCNIKFESKNELKKHERTHDVNSFILDTYQTNTKTDAARCHVCNICQNNFANKATLKRHLMIKHEVAGSFSCGTCKKAFGHSKEAQEHLKTNVTCSKPFVCQCYKRFPSHSALKRHQTTHSDQRPYECEVCRYTVKTKDKLRRHMDVHSKERLKCEICKKKFRAKCGLKRHTLKNCCKLRHECQKCSAKFIIMKNLYKHQLIHEEGRVLFTCDECGVQVDSKKGISRHLRRMHM